MVVAAFFGAQLNEARRRKRKCRVEAGIIFDGLENAVYIVKADRPPVPFVIRPGRARDSEENEIEVSELIKRGDVEVTVESTNGNAVAIALNEDRLSGEVSFGAPGDAQVVVTFAKQDGTILAKLDAGFHVTAGDPTTIFGATMEFEGLAEETVPARTPEPVAVVGEPGPSGPQGDAGEPGALISDDEAITEDTEEMPAASPADAVATSIEPVGGPIGGEEESGGGETATAGTEPQP